MRFPIYYSRGPGDYLSHLFKSLTQDFSWLHFLFYGFIILTVFLLSFCLFVLSIYLYQRSEIGHQLEQYQEWVYGRSSHSAYKKKPPIQIYGLGDHLIGEYLPERGSWMTMPVCSKLKWLKPATILAEDRNFYSHSGVDYRGIARAAWRNLLSFSLKEGGGTLSQQLARNLFTGRQRSFYRKLYETFIAFQIEAKLTKDEILCLYLNKIYMGEGRIGAEEASWFYFAKAPWQLDAAESAMLVGLFPSPANYSPLNNIRLSLKKQRRVLDHLVRANKLSQKQRNLAISRFKRNYQVKEGTIADHGNIALYGASRDFRYNIAPTVNEYVKNFLYKSIPEDLIRQGNLHVYTTIDPERQAVALKLMRKQTAHLRQQMLHKNQGADSTKLKQLVKQLNGVFVSIDPFNGDLQAIVGGYRVDQGSLSQRVWSMLRQPGSSIKGLLYASAIDEGKLNFTSMVVDQPVNIHGYSPRNWNNRYLGEVPLQQAVAMSINTVAVQTLRDIGVSAFRKRLSAILGLSFLGRRNRFPNNLSLALGSGELTPLELARLYAALVNGGHPIQPRIIVEIEDHKHQLLWKASPLRPLNNPVLSKRSCITSIKLLESVFDDSMGGTAAPIGKRRLQNSNYLPFAIAGKTGTVQITSQTKKRYPKLKGVKDLWFVGLVPKEISVLWFGHDYGAPIPGSSLHPALTWAEYAQRALAAKIKGDFLGAEEWLYENEAAQEQEKQENSLLPDEQQTDATQEELERSPLQQEKTENEPLEQEAEQTEENQPQQQQLP